MINDICDRCNKKNHVSRNHEVWQNAQKSKSGNNNGDKPKKNMNIIINYVTISKSIDNLLIDL